jgi:hypothetical protein
MAVRGFEHNGVRVDGPVVGFRVEYPEECGRCVAVTRVDPTKVRTAIQLAQEVTGPNFGGCTGADRMTRTAALDLGHENLAGLVDGEVESMPALPCRRGPAIREAVQAYRAQMSPAVEEPVAAKVESRRPGIGDLISTALRSISLRSPRG